MVTDAALQCQGSVEVTPAEQELLLQRTTASNLPLDEEHGQTHRFERASKASDQTGLKQLKGWIRIPKAESGPKCAVCVYRLPEEQPESGEIGKAAKLRKKHWRKYLRSWSGGASWVLLVPQL